VGHRTGLDAVLKRKKRTDHLEDKGVDGRIILGWILSKWGEKV
jgi:hypothetical protein